MSRIKLTTKASGDERSSGFYTVECKDSNVVLGIIDLAFHPDGLGEDAEYVGIHGLPVKNVKVTIMGGTTLYHEVYISISEEWVTAQALQIKLIPTMLKQTDLDEDLQLTNYIDFTVQDKKSWAKLFSTIAKLS